MFADARLAHQGALAGEGHLPLQEFQRVGIEMGGDIEVRGGDLGPGGPRPVPQGVAHGHAPPVVLAAMGGQAGPQLLGIETQHQRGGGTVSRRPIRRAHAYHGGGIPIAPPDGRVAHEDAFVAQPSSAGIADRRRVGGLVVRRQGAQQLLQGDVRGRAQGPHRLRGALHERGPQRRGGARTRRGMSDPEVPVPRTPHVRHQRADETPADAELGFPVLFGLFGGLRRQKHGGLQPFVVLFLLTNRPGAGCVPPHFATHVLPLGRGGAADINTSH